MLLSLIALYGTTLLVTSFVRLESFHFHAVTCVVGIRTVLQRTFPPRTFPWRRVPQRHFPERAFSESPT